MTPQIPNSIILNGESFRIIRVNEGELFTPQDIGIFPIANTTACWRGYISTYKISNGNLVLDNLRLSLPAKEQNIFGKFFYKIFPKKTPLINGVSPSPSKPEAIFTLYEDINLEIKFTGSMLVARGFIGKYWAYEELNPDWTYQTAFELTFENGKNMEIRDVSYQFEQTRNKVTRSFARSDTLNSTENRQEKQTSTNADTDDDIFAKFRER